MIGLTDILVMTVWPALVASGVYAVTRWARGPAWLAGCLALAIGYTAGQWGLDTRSELNVASGGDAVGDTGESAGWGGGDWTPGDQDGADTSTSDAVDQDWGSDIWSDTDWGEGTADDAGDTAGREGTADPEDKDQQGLPPATDATGSDTAAEGPPSLARRVAQWLPAVLGRVTTMRSPLVARDWLPWLALAAVGVVAGAAVFPDRPWFIWFLRVTLVVSVVLRLLWQSVYMQMDWSPWQKGIWVSGLSLLGVAWLLAWCATRWGRVRRSAGVPVAVAWGALAPVLMLSGSQAYGELAAVLATCWAAVWCWAWLWGDEYPHVAWAPVAITLGGCLLVSGYFYAELRTEYAWGLLVGLITAGMVVPETWQPRRVLIARFLGVAVCCGAVLATASYRFYQATIEPANDSYQMYDAGEW